MQYASVNFFLSLPSTPEGHRHSGGTVCLLTLLILLCTINPAPSPCAFSGHENSRSARGEPVGGKDRPTKSAGYWLDIVIMVTYLPLPPPRTGGSVDLHGDSHTVPSNLRFRDPTDGIDTHCTLRQQPECCCFTSGRRSR